MGSLWATSTSADCGALGQSSEVYGEKFGGDFDAASGGALGISGRHIFSYVNSWQPNSKQLESDVVRRNTETVWRKETEECVRGGWGWGEKEGKRGREERENE